MLFHKVDNGDLPPSLVSLAAWKKARSRSPVLARGILTNPLWKGSDSSLFTPIRAIFWIPAVPP